MTSEQLSCSNELLTLQQRYHNVENEKNELENKCQKLQEKCKKWQEKCKDLVSKKRDIQNDYNTLEDQYEDLEIKYTSLQSNKFQSEQYDFMNSMNNMFKEGLMMENTNLKNTSEQIQQQYDKLFAKYSDLQSSTNSLQTEIKILASNHNDLIIKYDTLQQTQQLQKTTQSKYIKLKQKYDKQITVSQSLQQKCNECTRKYDSINHHYKKQNTEIIHLKKSKHDINQKYDQLVLKCERIQNDYKHLIVKYNELQKQYDETRNMFAYLGWNAKDITNWIVNIDSIRYKKYYNVLFDNMCKECIDGECLVDLDRNDLHRLGVTEFKDKRDIYVSIQELCSNKMWAKVAMQNDWKEQCVENKKCMNEYKELEMKYESLEIRYVERIKKCDFLTWDDVDIVYWIVDLNKEEYMQYWNVLMDNMVSEDINGKCLRSVDRNDLHRLGINKFKHKCFVYNCIQELVKSENDCSYMNDKDCVICMDDNQMFACIPCGHLCLCGKCKDLINGSCPVCASQNETLVRIYC